MKIITSPSGVASGIRPSQGLRDLKKAGFEGVLLDFGLFCPVERIWPGEKLIKQSEAFNPEQAKSGFVIFLKTCEESKLNIEIAEVPFLEAITKRTDLYGQLIRLAGDCIIACETNGVNYIIAEPLFSGIERGQEWEENLAYYKKLAGFCQKDNTKLLLKNQLLDVGGHLCRGNVSEPEEIRQWVDELNKAVGFNRFGFCLDMGVCNICGQDLHELIIQLDGYLDAVIIRDNDSKTDQSILPFVVNGDGGGTDYLGLIRGLRDIGFDGNLIFEYETTAKAFPPMLKPAILQVAKQVADYFKWQIEIENALKRYQNIVLFGAGNMCRNYMKNYGEKYPPLFTCDNNASRWGEVFCGLEIKSPDSLRDLPVDTAVFICNVYYREIEAQLRELGVVNVEYFNDEYMPSFFMDRLARS